MGITVSPLTPGFAAEVGDVDFSRPLAEAEIAEIKELFWEYGILVFPEQELTEDQHLDFARHFGPLETSITAARKGSRMRLRKELADVSNLDHKDEVWGERSRQRLFQMANRLWHTDSSFKYRPALASLLYARSIAPIGGRTEFADMRAAYDALPEETRRRLEGLVAEHSIMNSRARIDFADFNEGDYEQLPPVPQMMARTLPENGRKTLYLASHAGRIMGMPDVEGRALIDQLLEHATQRQFVYSHRWRLHDLVMWDDRCTMHRQTDFDDLRWRRDFQRATVSDIANTCEQASVSGVA